MTGRTSTLPGCKNSRSRMATLDTAGDKFQKTESVMDANVPDPGPVPSVNPEQGTLLGQESGENPRRADAGDLTARRSLSLLKKFARARTET